MKRILVILILLFPLSAYGANKYVRPVADCPTSGDGTTWACASVAGGTGAYSDIPVNASDVLVQAKIGPGDTAYLAGSDNAYNSGDSYVRVGTTNSTQESQRIIFKKATAADHGTDTGWDASFGTKQAILPIFTFSGSAENAVSYVTIDGVYRSTATSGYGFKSKKYSGYAFDSSSALGDVNNIIVQYVEIEGYDGNIPDLAQDDGICGSGIKTTLSTSFLVQYCYIHDVFVPFQVGESTNTSIKNNIIVRNESSPANHSNGIASEGGCNGLIVDSNWFEDIQGTAWIGLLAGQYNGITVTNNVFVSKNTNAANPIGTSHGILSTNRFKNSIKNLKVYNNTIINAQYDSNAYEYLRSGCAGSCESKNNLWYCTAGESCNTAGVFKQTTPVLHYAVSGATFDWNQQGATVTCPNGSGSIPACANETACQTSDVIDIGTTYGSIRLTSTSGTFAASDACTTNKGGSFTVAAVSLPTSTTSTNNYYYGNTAQDLTETGSQYPVSNENPFVDYSNYDFRLAGNGNSALSGGYSLSAYFTTDKDSKTRSRWSIGAYEYIGNFTLGTGGGFFLGTSGGGMTLK